MPKKSEKKQAKTSKKIKPEKISNEEFEKKVVELGKKGMTSEKIGEHLRRQGIHPKEHNKKISAILKEKNIYENPDFKNMEKKLEKTREHFSKNKGDKRAMRERDRVFSRLRRIRLYLER
jgi:ribosomal protein S15P/S13E